MFRGKIGPERFKKLKTVCAARPGGGNVLPRAHIASEELALELVSVRMAGKIVICKFKGINTPEEIRKYQGMEFWIDRSEAVPLEEGAPGGEVWPDNKANKPSNYLGASSYVTIPKTGALNFTCHGNELDPSLRPNANFHVNIVNVSGWASLQWVGL